MAATRVYLEKADDSRRPPSIVLDGELTAFWRGTADGATLTIVTGLVKKGEKPPFVKTFESAALALEALERAAAVQESKGFVRVREAKTPAPRRSKGAAVELRFHRRLFASLGVEPRRSTAAVKALAEREAACGVSFPASVREFFELAGVHALFEQHTNADRLVPLATLGSRRDVAAGFLEVALENQGVVAFFVKLDGSDDPPVVHNDDHFDVPLADVPWVECADHFSEFLRDLMLE